MGFFEKPKNVRYFRIIFYAFIIVTIALGFVIPRDDTHFYWEGVPGFFALFGGVGCMVIVVVAKTIGYRWLLRREDYYD